MDVCLHTNSTRRKDVKNNQDRLKYWRNKTLDTRPCSDQSMDQACKSDIIFSHQREKGRFSVEVEGGIPKVCAFMLL